MILPRDLQTRIPLLFAALLAGMLGGCSEAPGPAASWESWLGHLREGRLEVAFEMLAEDSRRALARLEARDGAPEPTPADLDRTLPPGFRLFRERVAPASVGGVPPVPAEPSRWLVGQEVRGSEARLSVRIFTAAPNDADARTDVVRLVREDGQWRILLAAPRSG